MTWKSGYRVRKAPSNCKCGHPQITHYSKEGNCVFPGCGCQELRAKGRPEFANVKRGKCQYNHAHDSGLEIKTCFDFHLQKLSGEIKDFSAQVFVDLPGPSGAIVARYKVDFRIDHNDGSIEYVETKGDHLMRLQPWPLKWALIQDKHKGDLKYRFRVIRG